MEANKTGIILKRAELKALLLFASNDPSDANRFGVQFILKGRKLFAYATDGRRSLEAVGKVAEGCDDIELVVHRPFLAKLLKLTASTAKVEIDESGEVHRGSVDTSADDELAEQFDSGHYQMANAALTQCSFPQVRSEIKIPRNGELTGCVALPADVMSDLSVVGQAVGKKAAIDCYTPSSPDQPVIYRVGANTATVWTVALATYSSEATAKATKKSAKKASDARQLQLEKKEQANAADAEPKPEKVKVSKPAKRGKPTAVARNLTVVKSDQ